MSSDALHMFLPTHRTILNNSVRGCQSPVQQLIRRKPRRSHRAAQTAYTSSLNKIKNKR